MVHFEVPLSGTLWVPPDTMGRQIIARLDNSLHNLGFTVRQMRFCPICSSEFIICSFCSNPAPVSDGHCPNCKSTTTFGVVESFRRVFSPLSLKKNPIKKPPIK